MKIAVFGAGAMGSLYAARFAMAGHSVVAVDPWEAHVSAINASGLRMRGPDGDHHIKGIQASLSPDLAEARRACGYRHKGLRGGYRRQRQLPRSFVPTQRS